MVKRPTSGFLLACLKAFCEKRQRWHARSWCRYHLVGKSVHRLDPIIQKHSSYVLLMIIVWCQPQELEWNFPENHERISRFLCFLLFFFFSPASPLVTENRLKRWLLLAVWSLISKNEINKHKSPENNGAQDVAQSLVTVSMATVNFLLTFCSAWRCCCNGSVPFFFF